jgi:hypothetical protein
MGDKANHYLVPARMKSYLSFSCQNELMIRRGIKVCRAESLSRVFVKVAV